MSSVRDILSDDRGVTPVIGIILVVALAIVMSALVGQYVFGLDIIENQDPGPQVAWDTEYDGAAGNLTIIHDGGDKIENPDSRLRVVVSDNTHEDALEVHIPEEDMTADDSIVVEHVSQDATVLLVWENPSTDDSILLFDWNNRET